MADGLPWERAALEWRWKGQSQWAWELQSQD